MLSFPSVKTAVDSQYTLRPSQKIWLEWNYNIHAGINEMGIDDVPLYQYDNTISDLKLIETSTVYNKYYESLYPLTSVSNFIRPGEYALHNNQKVGGIVKSIFGNSVSGLSNYDLTSATRNYFVSKDDGYKYWAFIRKNQSSTAVNKSIYLNYDRTVKVNKLVVKFETSHTVPNSYTVFVRQSGAWVQAYTSSTPLTNGGLALYYNGSAWNTTKHTSPSVTTNTQEISGIKVLVSTVNVGYSPLEIIEVSGRLEADVSAETVSWTIDKTYFEDHEVLPVGEISSNSASINFDNTSNIYSYENTSAKYAGLVDKRICVKIFTIIDSNEVPQFTGFTDAWSLSANDTATVSCYDMAKILQQTQAPDMVIGSNLPISRVIRTIFDSAGLNEVQIDTAGSSTQVVDIFWMSKDQTIWQALQQLCMSNQCSIFVDEYGKFIFKSRSTVLDSSTVEQVLTYNNSGSILSNIVSIDQSAKPRIGNLTVKYSRRSYETQSDVITTYQSIANNPKEQLVSFRGSSYATSIWDPGEAWVLGAAPLVYPITQSEVTSIQTQAPEMQQVIQKNGEVVWKVVSGLTSFSGYFYLNGEIIYYGGTRHKVSYKDGRASENINISSRQQFESLIQADPGISTITNTGILTEIKRAQFSTMQIAHTPVSTDNGLWSRKQFKIGTTTQTSLTAPSFSLQQRALKLSTDNDSGASKISSLSNQERRKYVQVGLVDLKKTNYKRFECTMRIVNKQPGEEMGDVDSLGGIFFDYNPTNNSGYFIELGLDYTSSTYKTTNANKSVNIYKINSSGNISEIKSIESLTGRARTDSPENIFKDTVSFETVQDYDIQVLRVDRNGKRCIDLYIMGQLIVQVEDSNPLSPTNKAGVFVRGDSTAFFTKFAAWGANNESTLQDGSFFADSIRGFMTEIVAAGNLGVASKVSLEKDYDYYEFYPHMREIRVAEFDYTKFPASPLKISAGPAITLYGATILESNSFRGKVAVVNETNSPVDLASTFPGTTTAVYPKLLGYALKKFEPREYKTTISKAKSDDAKFEIDSEWIQSEGQAKDIAEFIKLNSVTLKNGKLNDIIILDVEIFANPLIQLGDTVDVIHPDLGISATTHTFVVTRISQEFNGGISTSVRLQEIP
jgi:hypothetical protein